MESTAAGRERDRSLPGWRQSAARAGGGGEATLCVCGAEVRRRVVLWFGGGVGGARSRKGWQRNRKKLRKEEKRIVGMCVRSVLHSTYFCLTGRGLARRANGLDGPGWHGLAG